MACALTLQGGVRSLAFLPRSLTCSLPFLGHCRAVLECRNMVLFPEAFSKVWMSTVPPDIRQGKAEASPLQLDADQSRHLLCSAK